MQAQSLETPDDYHDLIVHLLHSGGPLWVPGCQTARAESGRHVRARRPADHAAPPPDEPETDTRHARPDHRRCSAAVLVRGARAPGARPRLRAVRARMAGRRRALGRRAQRRGTLRGYRHRQARRPGPGALLVHTDDIPADWADA